MELLQLTFTFFALSLAGLGLLLLWLEARHRLEPSSPLKLKFEAWRVSITPGRYCVEGFVTINNPHGQMEVFVPELRAKPRLLASESLKNITLTTRVEPRHPDEESRADDYWFAYIVKGHKSTQAKISIWIEGEQLEQRLDSLWVDIHWVNYGPFGRLKKREGLLVPLKHPAPVQPQEAKWREGDRCYVLAVPTHLLGVLDNVETILRNYAGAVLQPGDILTIAESPLAVMQGRYQHPSEIVPSALARSLCRVFHPTSSLATACGLQSLINSVGPARVLMAWLLGALLKLAGIKGGFYRLAGPQARLIDDVTGSTPPYDQTIVMGPEDPEKVVQLMAAALGHGVAVVDVNDLGRVKILAASRGCDLELLERALKPNPAGNANERTPLVVVRPRS
ncbi:MAG: F420-0:Gamma-glutamyl ligase [Cyanobacteria bacterium]|nr:F420-0:Gamma-glutamyl ligase [Cyanobacteriota bacterium]